MFTLEKKPGRDFVLLNLSDPQLATENWEEGSEARRILTGTVTELLERVKPDLVTVSGDISYSDQTPAYDLFGDLMDSCGVPWAPVLGNHDNQGGEEWISKIADSFLRHCCCLFEKGDPKYGCGNYVIRITENGKPVEGILMMDSHNREDFTNPDGTVVSEWGRLWPCQLDWYRDEIAALEADGCHDSTLIMHIPVFGYRTAWEAAIRPDVNPKEMTPEDSTGAKWWNPGYESAYGVRYEGICSYPAEEGMADLVVSLGSTKHMIAGHDHVNNFVIPWRGVKWIYSLKAGAGCYWRKNLNGGTVLTIGSSGVTSVRHEFVDPAPFMDE